MPLRRGITLLEVMISVGVLAVGVMSIASLLPVGRYQMSQAAVFDEVSALGRAAFRSLQVNGCLRPSMWLYVGPPLAPVINGPLINAPPGGGSSAGVAPPTTLASFERTPPAMPLVLDPIMVGLNIPPSAGTNYTGANTSVTQPAVATFPYFLQNGGFAGGSPESTAPKIPRVTLRDAPITATIQNTIRAMPLAVADRWFRSTDDVAFYVPTGINLAGTSSSISVNTSVEYIGSGNTLLTRGSHGNYSYFVVLSPDFGEVWGAPGGYPIGASTTPGASYNMLQGDASTNRLFSVAVVVCYQRDLRTLTNMTPSTTYDRGERMAWVDFVGRGEVRLRITGVAQQPQAQQMLDIKPNQWIMVTGQIGQPHTGSAAGNQTQNYMPVPPQFTNRGQTPNWAMTVAKWYRVLSVSSQPIQDLGNPSTWYCSARVTGPDWTVNGASDGNIQNMIYNDANAFTYSDLGNSPMPDPPTGWGTIVTGAIGVYEKTITLDDSSAFSF